MTTVELLTRATVLGRLGRILRRVIGVPDYEAYLAHMEAHHPGECALTRAAFERERLEAKYSRPGTRCC